MTYPHDIFDVRDPHDNEREARILRMRYGIEPMSLKDIGEKVGLTRERVRQIENEARRRLNQLVTEELDA